MLETTPQFNETPINKPLNNNSIESIDIEVMRRHIFKYELDIYDINQFNTFYLEDIESKLHGTTLFKFNIKSNFIKLENNLLIKNGNPFIKLFIGNILINNLFIYLCKCNDDKSFKDYNGIGQCKCSIDSIKGDYIIKEYGSDKYIEIYLNNYNIINNNVISLRLDYIMEGIKHIQRNNNNESIKRLKLNNNLFHYELIFQNINYKNTFIPHFRVPSFIILKYILPESLSVISSLSHITSLNYTNTHKIFVYSSICLINNIKYNISIGKISFIIGTFKKYALQLDSVNFNNKVNSNKVKQISAFKNLQDAERNSGSNFYIFIPEFLTNPTIDFTNKYSFMITELLKDVSISIKFLEKFLGINYFSFPINGKYFKNDFGLLFSISEIEISNSIGISIIPFSNSILENDHRGIINFKKKILQIIINQIIPINYHSFDYHTFNNNNIFKGLIFIEKDFIKNPLINIINNINNENINQLYKLSIILEYINQYINYNNEVKNIWLQKGLNRFLYAKLCEIFFGKSFIEIRKQDYINILESFDKTNLPLINLEIDLNTFFNTFLLLNQSLELFEMSFSNIIKSLKSKYLNIFNFNNDVIINLKDFHFFNLYNKNNSFRYYESYNDPVTLMKCELIFHCLESSSGIIVFNQTLKSMFSLSNQKENLNNYSFLSSSFFFNCLSNETMLNYSTFQEFYLKKSGIISINLLLKIDQKKSQINVFTEHLFNTKSNKKKINYNLINKRYYGYIPIESREVENNHSYIIESMNEYRNLHNNNSFSSMYHYLCFSSSSKNINKNCKLNVIEPDLKFTYYARSKKAKITEGLSFLYIQPDSNFEVLAKIRVLSSYAIKEKLEDRNIRTQLDAIETVERLLIESLFFKTNIEEELQINTNINNETEDTESIFEENSSSSFEDVNINNEKEKEKKRKLIKEKKRKEFRKKFLNKQITSDYIYNPNISQNLDILLSCLFDELTNIYVKYKIIDLLILYDYQKIITFFIKYYCIINSTIIKPIYELNKEDLFLLEYILERLSFIFKYNNLYINNIFKSIININEIFSSDYKIKKSMVLIDFYISILKYIDSTNSSADYLISKCIKGIYIHESLLLYYKPDNLKYIMDEIRLVLEKIFLYEFINQSIRNSIFVNSLNFIIYRFIRGEINLNINYLINLTKYNNYINIRKIAFDGILLNCRINDNNKCREFINYILLNNKEKEILFHILNRIKKLIKFNKFNFFIKENISSNLCLNLMTWDCELNEICKSIKQIYKKNNELFNKKIENNNDDFIINLNIKSIFKEKQKLPLNINSNPEILFPKLYKPLKYEPDEDNMKYNILKSTPLIKSNSNKHLKDEYSFEEDSLSNDNNILNIETYKKKVKLIPLIEDSNSSLEFSKSFIEIKEGKSKIFTDMFNYKNLFNKINIFNFKIKVKRIIHMSEIGVIILKMNNESY